MADVLIVMGSDSDWPTMRQGAEMLDDFGIEYTAQVLSAHRTPQRMLDVANAARRNGVKVIIAGAGGAAHLPGMMAASTTLPVIGVPVPLQYLDGMDSLLSIVQMPKGIPVATVSIGNAANAGLLAARILGATDPAIADQLAQYAKELEDMVDDKDAALQKALHE